MVLGDTSGGGDGFDFAPRGRALWGGMQARGCAADVGLDASGVRGFGVEKNRGDLPGNEALSFIRPSGSGATATISTTGSGIGRGVNADEMFDFG